jgi:hypothetical protein
MLAEILYMKHTIKFIVPLLILISQATLLYGQNSLEAELKTKEDYIKHEPTLIQAAQWLETTPLDVEPDKRKAYGAFAIRYISGSPSITVEIGNLLMDLVKKNESLLPIYLASYGRHVLESKGTATQLSSSKAALTSIINVYKRGVLMTKNKEMNKLLKFTDAELEIYIAGKLPL